MKFLVFGFNAAAETGYYVERCAAICEREPPTCELMEVATSGGLQPDT